jgi:hypothetical protein
MNNDCSDLSAANEQTAEKLEENRKQINRHRRSLLEDRAGIAPRMYAFDVASVRAQQSPLVLDHSLCFALFQCRVRRQVDNSLRLVQNLKEFKNEMFSRLSQPWSFGQFC